jgi:hypothetical protein
MDRRSFLALGSAIALTEIPSGSALASFDPSGTSRTATQGNRHPVLVRAGLTRLPDGTEQATTSQQTVVRSFDTEGRLAAFVVPVGEHEPYGGAPLHVHHEQDE